MLQLLAGNSKLLLGISLPSNFFGFTVFDNDRNNRAL
jgi:hypothetical protein